MKPQFIQHRVNTLAQLTALQDKDLGCEIDLRSDVNRPGSLILSHDPYQAGEEFNPWLARFKASGYRGPLILNTKEDGLEPFVLQELKKHHIENYFFLDTQLPTLVRLGLQGLRHFALRLSAYEPLEAVLRLQHLASWIWVDCFEARALEIIPDLKSQTSLKICLVSPELQGGSVKDIKQFAAWSKVADAVCTKSPHAWTSQAD